MNTKIYFCRLSFLWTLSVFIFLLTSTNVLIGQENVIVSESLTYASIEQVQNDEARLADLLETKLTNGGFVRGMSDRVMTLDIMIEHPYAIIGYYVADPAHLPDAFSPNIALGYFANNNWEVFIREIDQEAFNTILNAIPESLLSSDIKPVYKFYPSGEMSLRATYTGHYLPWQNGVAYYVTQWPGNCGSHCGLAAHAWDFGIPYGGEIWSSKAGHISHMQDGNARGAFSWNSSWDLWCTPSNSPANYIVVNHDQGASVYVHLQQYSIPGSLQSGTFVNRATFIGRSGNVGYVCSGTNTATSGTHLHYQVGVKSSSTYWTQSGSVDFVDWNEQGNRPTSGNVPIHPPGKPVISSPAQSTWLGSQFTIQIQSGNTNDTGAQSWRIQVDDQSDFSSPDYDEWKTSTSASITLPQSADTVYKTYYIRVRQRDSINQSSSWSNTRTIYVVNTNQLELINPTGSPNSIYANPRFRWTDLAGMTDYEFYVIGDNDISIHETLSDDDYCDGIVCNAWMRDINPNYYITNGNYQVWMRGYNADASTAWRGPYDFAIDIAPPTAPTAEAPTGLNTPYPTIRWSTDDDSARAIWFNVILVDESNSTQVFNEWRYYSDVCTDNNCALSSPVTLQNGTAYVAYIGSWGAGGFNTGDYAATASFTPDVSLPGLLQRTLPANFAIPRYDWTVDPNATWYHFVIDGPDGTIIDQWLAEAEVCGENSCRFPERPYLTNGDYEWHMGAWGPGGMGEYDTIAYTIALDPPVTPVLTAPTGEVEPGAVTLTWDAITNSSWVYLNLSGPDGEIVDSWMERASICDNGVCNVEVELNTLGEYEWVVGSWGPGGMGEYSSATFAVSKDTPGLIQRTLPANFAVPRYDWTADPNASWYHFIITGPHGTEVDEWLASENVCVAGACRLPYRPYLVNGDYEWWMAAWGVGGMGEYDGMSFSIALDAPPTPTITAPSGDVSVGTVTLTWDAVPDSSWLHVFLNDYEVWYERAEICVGGVCTLELELPSGGYSWWLGSWGPGGMGEYADRNFNVVE